MSIQIGEINVASQIIENEFRIAVLERIVNRLMRSMPVIGGVFAPGELDFIRNEVIAELQKKYPNSAIALKSTTRG